MLFGCLEKFEIDARIWMMAAKEAIEMSGISYFRACLLLLSVGEEQSVSNPEYCWSHLTKHLPLLCFIVEMKVSHVTHYYVASQSHLEKSNYASTAACNYLRF